MIFKKFKFIEAKITLKKMVKIAQTLIGSQWRKIKQLFLLYIGDSDHPILSS
jgi:hypothetical protein